MRFGVQTRDALVGLAMWLAAMPVEDRRKYAEQLLAYGAMLAGDDSTAWSAAISMRLSTLLSATIIDELAE